MSMESEENGIERTFDSARDPEQTVRERSIAPSTVRINAMLWNHALSPRANPFDCINRPLVIQSRENNEKYVLTKVAWTCGEVVTSATSTYHTFTFSSSRFWLFRHQSCQSHIQLS